MGPNNTCLNERYIKVPPTDINVIHFLSRVVLNKGIILSPLFFNFPLKYIILEVQRSREGLEMKRMYQLQEYGYVTFFKKDIMIYHIEIAICSSNGTDNVFAQSNTWIIDLNLTQGLNVCPSFFHVRVVLCR
jgi:hypothetical protein